MVRMRVRCEECGHDWNPRYDKHEYQQFGGDRRLRCPADDCHNGKKDGFSVLTDQADSAHADTPVSRAELASGKDELKGTIADTFHNLIGEYPTAVEQATGPGRFHCADDLVEAPAGLEATSTKLYHLFDYIDEIETHAELKEYRDEVDTALEHAGECESYRNDISQLQAELSELREEKATRKADIRWLRDEADGRSAEVDALKAELDDVRAELETERQALQELKAEATERGYESYEDILTIIGIVDSLREKKRKMEAEIHRLNQQFNQKRQTLQSTNSNTHNQF